MSALLVLAAATVAASEPLAVTQSSRWPGTDAVAPKLVADLHEALRRAGVEALDDAATRERAKAANMPDPRTCKGMRGCLLKLAVALNAVVVAVDVGKLADKLVVRVEVLAADQAEPLDVLELNTTTRGWVDDTVVPVNQLARRVKEKLSGRSAPAAVAPAPEPVREVPRAEPAAQPRVQAAPAAVVEQPPAEPSRSRAPALVTGGAGAVAAAVGGLLLGLSYSARADVTRTYGTDTQGRLTSSFMRADLDARTSAVNAQLAAGIAAAAIGAALLAVAIALWVGT